MWISVIYFCDQSCIFSIITPVFSVTWSSEIIIIYWFAAQETFLIIINVENSCAAQYCWDLLFTCLLFITLIIISILWLAETCDGGMQIVNIDGTIKFIHILCTVDEEKQ